jgi:SAM-dependent methyltransferase
MAAELTSEEIRLIQAGIRRKYVQVATADMACCFRFPVGLEGLRLQNYPLELCHDVPEAVLAGYCGVGNPFSLGPLKAGEAVLDIGCGAGVDSLVAALMVGPEGRVVGLDVTPEMVDRARNALTPLGLGQLSFEVSDAESLPFPDQSFDAVISNGVFNLVVHKDRALKEVYRVLRPGGRVMLADMLLVSPLPEDRAGRIENWYQ